METIDEFENRILRRVITRFSVIYLILYVLDLAFTPGTDIGPDMRFLSLFGFLFNVGAFLTLFARRKWVPIAEAIAICSIVAHYARAAFSTQAFRFPPPTTHLTLFGCAQYSQRTISGN